MANLAAAADRTAEEAGIAPLHHCYGLNAAQKALWARYAADEVTGASDPWFVLYVRPQTEIMTFLALRRVGLTAWLPTCEVKIGRRGREKRYTRTIFSQMVFVQAPDLEAVARAVYRLEWALGVFGQGKAPLRLTPQQFGAFRFELSGMLPRTAAVRRRDWAEGDMVEVQGGPFEGWVGQVVGMRDGAAVIDLGPYRASIASHFLDRAKD